MDPVILATARKHGIEDTAVLHAYRNPIRTCTVDDMVMLIGADEAGRLLETGVVTGVWTSSCTPWPLDPSS